MFNSNNGTPFSMPVAPLGYGNGMNGNCGWGDDWIALLIVAALFGGGGFGFGGGWGGGLGLGMMEMFLPFMFMNGWGGFGGWGGNGNCATQADVREAVDQQTLISKLDQQTYGIADSFTAINNTLNNNFRGIDNAICNLGFQTQQGFNQATIANLQGQNALATQLADCCCRTQSGLKEIQFQNAQDTCATTTAIAQAARDIVDNQNLNYRALHDEIVANRIEDKNAIIAQQSQQIFQYQLAASQANQTTDIKNGILTELRNCPVGTYPVPNPNCCYGANITFGNPYNGYGNGCGCGNNGGCGCC